MEKFLYTSHPATLLTTGPSECGKSVFLTNLILIIFIECDKKYIYSLSLHQELYQKLIKCFSNSIPINKILKMLYEEDIDMVTDEIVKIKDRKKSDTEIEAYETIEELKYPQDYNNGGITILDD